MKIAEALGVSVNYFLDTQEPDVSTRLTKDFHFFTLVKSKMQLARISSMNPKRQLKPLLLVFLPRSETEGAVLDKGWVPLTFHLSQIRAEAKWTRARELRVSLSKREKMRR